MRAKLEYVTSNEHLDWEEFVAADRPEPWIASGWFSVEVGREDEPGSEMFQVFGVTPAAASRAKPERGQFRHTIVESFKPEVIARALQEYIASIPGSSWVRFGNVCDSPCGGNTRISMSADLLVERTLSGTASTMHGLEFTFYSIGAL